MKQIIYLSTLILITSCIPAKRYQTLERNLLSTKFELNQIEIAEKLTISDVAKNNPILKIDAASTPEQIKQRIDQIKASCLNAADKPKDLESLTGGYDVFYDEFTEDFGAKINLIPFGTISGSRNSKVIVYNFLQFKNSSCKVDERNESITWGAGIKLTLHVKSSRNSVNLSSLPAIAAAVNYDRAKVTYKIKVQGITGDKVRLKLANQGEFNVENYGKLVSSIDEIIKIMSDDEVNVDPQLVLLENSI